MITFGLSAVVAIVSAIVVGRVRAKRHAAVVRVEGDEAPRFAAYRVLDSGSSRWRHGTIAVERATDRATWRPRFAVAGGPVELWPLVVTGSRRLTASERYWRLNPELQVVEAVSGTRPVELAVFPEGVALLERRFGELI